jgi:hypothetical protein
LGFGSNLSAHLLSQSVSAGERHRQKATLAFSAASHGQRFRQKTPAFLRTRVKGEDRDALEQPNDERVNYCGY